ncbi:MAG: hypothetical protein AB7F31_07260 [Parachlamydiales bacterium]
MGVIYLDPSQSVEANLAAYSEGATPTKRAEKALEDYDVGCASIELRANIAVGAFWPF